MPIPTTWLDPEPVVVPDELVGLVGHRLAAELLVRRGFTTVEAARPFVDPGARAPTPWHELPGVEAAVARLRRAVERHERVLIWGDFDVDGQTATAVLVESLRRLGLDPAWHVPRRAADSHGLNPSCLDYVHGHAATLLVTCDCGIGDVDHVAALAAADVDTIITDHHPLPARLAGHHHPAHAVVSPHALPADHAARRLAGVGVAFFVAAGLLASFGEDPEWLLDLVALGTVADVAPLVDENRHLVQRGLPRLNAGHRPGIAALIELAGRHGGPTDASLAGWIIAPPLNAFGRLGKADPAVELLLSRDEAQARQIATDAHNLNATRQSLCDQIVEEASLVIEACLESGDAPPAPSVVSENVIFIANASWHVGVIGLAAGRLAQLYLRPVALASRDAEGHARVSMRSAPWCDLHRIAAELAADPALAFRGGGHSAAAGGTLPWENRADLSAGLDQAAARQRPPGAIARELRIDAALRLGDVTLEACAALARLAPFGLGNPSPLLLARGVRIVEPPRLLGPTARHLRLSLADEDGARASALWWSGAGRAVPAGRVDLCLTLEENDYNGASQPRLVVQALRPAVRPVVQAR